MRSFFARLALVGTFGAVITGCGTTNGSSLPVGAFPNGAGGAPQAAITNQPPPSFVTATVLGLSIVGAYTPATAFTGYDNTATDAASASAYGTDTQVADSGKPPTGVPNHLISFTGNNTPVVNFRYTGTAPALVLPPLTPGEVQPQNYGAIILHAPAIASLAPVGTAKPSAVFVELVGGAGGTAYDVRLTCTPGTVVKNGLVRYVCPLPAYGSPSTVGAQNLVRPGSTGTFTPTTSPIFYVGETFGGSATPAVASTFNVGYIYAEAGVL